MFSKLCRLPKKYIIHEIESKRYYAITYGPIVLGAPIDNTNIGKEEFRHKRKTVSDAMIPMSDTPVLFGTTAEIKANIRRVNGEELKFVYSPKEEKQVELIPYNRIHFNRYAIYMIHVADKQEYDQTVRDGSLYEDMNAKLGTLNTDAVFIGDADSEQMHKMEKVNSLIGKYDYTSYWRRAFDGGYFMYNLESLPDVQQTLYIAFRGNDQDKFAFDVLVDGCVIKSFVRNEGNLETKNYAEYIPVPLELTRGKKDVTVKIAARLRSMTGDVLDIRLLPANMVPTK